MVDQGWSSGGDPFARAADETYRLEAPLRLSTVAALRARGLALIEAAGAALTIDLSGVPAADSAGLALLIDWLSRARAAQKSLRYVAPPEELRALARLSDVERLIMASGGEALANGAEPAA